MMQYEAQVETVLVGVVAVEASPAGLACAARALGASLPDGPRSIEARQGLLHRSGPESLVLLCDPSIPASLAAALDSEVGEASAIVADLTDGHAWARIAGRDAVAVLSQGVAVDLREPALAPGQATRTLCFGLETILHREAADAFRVGCRASHGEFLVGRLRLACRPLREAS